MFIDKISNPGHGLFNIMDITNKSLSLEPEAIVGDVIRSTTKKTLGYDNCHIAQ